MPPGVGFTGVGFTGVGFTGLGFRVSGFGFIELGFYRDDIWIIIERMERNMETTIKGLGLGDLDCS